jgi:Succinylglutamate desuccinylase / Aspartoacylase family
MTFGAKTELIIKSGEHLLGQFIGNPSGVTLIVFGGIHGNEASGVYSIKRVLPQIEKLQAYLHGRVFFLAGNTRALRNGVRFIDSDLNRHWTSKNIYQNQPNLKNQPQISEDIEQKELLDNLNKIIRTAENEVYVLDLHSTSADGLPFATLGDTLRNRAFAQKFPITILLGIEEQLDGTILEYLNNLGTITLGFEAGQHFADSTIDNHEALIWLALTNSGCLKKEDFADYGKYFELLKKASGRERIVEIRHRELVKPETDGFEMKKGYTNFQPIIKDEVLAQNNNGEIKANESGMILMPLYQKLGNDGFFIGREVAPFWLWLSGILRKSRVQDLIRILPGIKKHPNEAGTLIVNTQIARLFPLQIFHLLGFRKRRQVGNRLFMSRRLHDTKSPFK